MIIGFQTAEKGQAFGKVTIKCVGIFTAAEVFENRSAIIIVWMIVVARLSTIYSSTDTAHFEQLFCKNMNDSRNYINVCSLHQYTYLHLHVSIIT